MRNKHTLTKPSRKSQITLFIILGIVIFMITGFLLYLTSLRTSQVGSQAEQSFSDIVEATPIRSYITSCLKKTAEDALILAGRQGGVIFENQDGVFRFIDPSIYTSNGARAIGNDYLPYTIDGTEYNVNFDVSIPEEGKEWPLGLKRFPKLCSEAGLNPKTSTTDLSHTCTGELYATDSNAATIQKALESYIAAKLPECVDFNAISESGITVEPAGDLKVGVLFGEDDVLILSEYPVKFSPQGEPPVTKDVQVTQSLPIRFKKIYESAYYLSEKDNTDVSFDITTTDSHNCPLNSLSNGQIATTLDQLCLKLGSDSNSIEDDMHIEKITDLCHNCDLNTDAAILHITDPQSTITGQPYSFYFAVQNRPPYLNIDPTTLRDVIERNTIDLTTYITFGDPDGGTTTVILSGGPPGFTNLTYGSSQGDAGYYTMTVTVEDSNGHQVTGQIQITINCPSGNNCCIQPTPPPTQTGTFYLNDGASCGACMTCRPKTCVTTSPPAITDCIPSYSCDSAGNTYSSNYALSGASCSDNSGATGTCDGNGNCVHPP